MPSRTLSGTVFHFYVHRQAACRHIMGSVPALSGKCVLYAYSLACCPCETLSYESVQLRQQAANGKQRLEQLNPRMIYHSCKSEPALDHCHQCSREEMIIISCSCASFSLTARIEIVLSLCHYSSALVQHSQPSILRDQAVLSTVATCETTCVWRSYGALSWGVEKAYEVE